MGLMHLDHDSPADSPIHDFGSFVEVHRSRDSGVWKAVEKATGLPVAIKTFHRQSMHAGHVFRMAQEMINLSCMQGSHVASVLAVFEDECRFYLVMGWCASGDLRQRLLHTQLDEHYIVTKVLHPLLRVLCRMHATGVMHRDIKPENLLLASDGAVLLGDFGLSINFLDNIPFACVGTTGYMAPEVLANEHAHLNEGADVTAQILLAHKAQRYTSAVDIWSLGVMAKELMLMANSSARSVPHAAASLECSPLLWWDFVQRACDVNSMRRATAQQLIHHPWLQQHLSPTPWPMGRQAMSHGARPTWPLALVDGQHTEQDKPRACGAQAGGTADPVAPPQVARRESSCRTSRAAPPALSRAPLHRSDSCTSFVSLDLGDSPLPTHVSASRPPRPSPPTSVHARSVRLCPDTPPSPCLFSTSFTSVSLSSPSADWRATAAVDCRSFYSEVPMPSRQCRRAWRRQEAGGRDIEDGSESGGAPSPLYRTTAPSGAVAKALRKVKKAWRGLCSGVRSLV